VYCSVCIKAMAACGGLHTFAVTEDGEALFACGDGGRGALGLGDEERRLSPARVVLPVRCIVVSASCGESHGACCTEGGEIMCWGDNTYGQLGVGDLEQRLEPTRVEGFDGDAVVLVSCGRFHTAAITEAGRLFTWGRGDHGRLGHGDRGLRAHPSEVNLCLLSDAPAQSPAPKVEMVALGAMHTLALTNAPNGNLWCWGWGCCGQLGLGDFDNRHMPARICGAGLTFEKSRAIFAAAGQMHSCALLEDGSLWTFGGGGDGKLGLGDTRSRNTPTLVKTLHDVLHVSAGDSHTAAVTRELQLYTWGDNAYGQLGLGEKGGGRAVPTCIPGMADVVQVACGENHTVAVDEKGTLWSWGGGGGGQLMHDDRKRRLGPTAVCSDRLGGSRVGRCRPISPDRALAFAMINHARLGVASPFAHLPTDLVGRIARMAHPWPQGAAGKAPGIMRLLGGGGFEG